MIYSVECSYTDPTSEAEWNAFYNHDKLPALISVPGFRSSQRFKAVRAGGPAYLALHNIDSAEVLQSDEYRRQGGGSFARWQPHIAHWQRTLYNGADAPAIAADQYLLLSATGPEPLIRLGLTPLALRGTAAQRWLATLDRPLEIAGDGLALYAPLTPQLSSAT